MKRPPELQAIFDDIERVGPFGSVEEINRVLAARAREYNLSPQAAIGGLSPDEMSQLLYGDWTSQGALRLNDALTLDELDDAPVLADARTLLDFIAAEGTVKETTARNLPRAAVARLLPRLRIPAQRRTALDIGEPPPLNEGDVLWLSALRHTMMFAGLLMRRKGVRVTPRGRELLRPGRAGEARSSSIIVAPVKPTGHSWYRVGLGVRVRLQGLHYAKASAPSRATQAVTFS